MREKVPALDLVTWRPVQSVSSYNVSDHDCCGEDVSGFMGLAHAVEDVNVSVKARERMERRDEGDMVVVGEGVGAFLLVRSLARPSLFVA